MGKILYPGVIIRHTGLSMRDAYSLLDDIENMHIIEKAYEVYCPICTKYTGEIYHSLSEVPDEFFCESCETDFTFKFPEGLIVVYRVITE